MPEGSARGRQRQAADPGRAGARGQGLDLRPPGAPPRPAGNFRHALRPARLGPGHRAIMGTAVESRRPPRGASGSPSFRSRTRDISPPTASVLGFQRLSLTVRPSAVLGGRAIDGGSPAGKESSRASSRSRLRCCSQSVRLDGHLVVRRIGLGTPGPGLLRHALL